MAEPFALRPSAARAASSVAPPSRPAADPRRARPGLEEDGRPLAMEQLGVPLNGLPDSLLAKLDELGPGWSWGRDADWDWFVERPGAGEGPGSGQRFTHPRSLRHAIAKARRALAAGAGEEGDPS